jgi:predicted alpha-1,6-mannanase (GH76 family)
MALLRLLILAAVTGTSTSTITSTNTNISTVTWAHAACATLQETWFNTTSGTWNGHNGQDETGARTQIGWWNAANSLEATVNCALLGGGGWPLEGSGKQQAPPSTDAIIDLFFRNENVTGIAGSRSYDDSGWVTLAWARAFERSGNAAFLVRAEAFWQQVLSEGWDDTCGGGLYWAGDGPQGNRYKNAISNSLFLTSSATLYRLTGNATYKEWAIKEWQWFNSTGLIVNGIVNGGLTSDCKNDGSEGYTYNQGVLLGGLSLLSNITGDPSLLATAEDIAEAVLASEVYVYRDGVLREPCEEKPHRHESKLTAVQVRSTCDDDQLQFKGVFMRYLRYFLEYAPAHKRASAAYQRYQAFLVHNAEAVWSRDRDERDGTFGLRWEGPLLRNHTRGAILQTSAVDCLTAAAALSRR